MRGFDAVAPAATLMLGFETFAPLGAATAGDLATSGDLRPRAAASAATGRFAATRFAVGAPFFGTTAGDRTSLRDTVVDFAGLAAFIVGARAMIVAPGQGKEP